MIKENIVSIVSLPLLVFPLCAQISPSFRDLDANELFRIPASEELPFTAIRDIETTSSGRMWVLDGRESRVYAFDESGLPVGSFGSRGSGPGEFVVATDLVLSDSLLIVVDQRQRRRSAFTLDGHHQWTRRLPTPNGLVINRLAFMRYGWWVASNTPRFVGAFDRRGKNVQVLLIPSDAQMIDTVASFRSRATTWADPSGSPWGVMVDSEFGASGAWAALGDSVLAVADGEAGVVQFYSMTSQGMSPTSSIDLGSSGRPVLREDLNVVEAAARNRQPGRIPRKISIYHPRVWSTAAAAIFGSQGDLWIRDATVASERGNWVRIDSSTVERWRLPKGFILRSVEGSVLYGSQNDEMDVPSIVVLEARYR